MKTKWIGLFLMVLAAVAVTPSFASNEGATNGGLNEGWGFEFTPYLWMTGIDADVTVNDRTASVSQGFSDLVDYVDVAGSFLSVTRYDRWVLWNQLDYFNLTSEQSTSHLGNADLDIKTLLYTGAFGYQFRTFKNSTIDVMAGVKYIELENDLTIDALGNSKKTLSATDAVLVIRPRIPFGKRWAFNPTLGIGTGDSDLTYEMQPQFQFQVTKNMAARFGYRRVGYKTEKTISGAKTEFDGAFSGAILGLGVTF